MTQRHRILRIHFILLLFKEIILIRNIAPAKWKYCLNKIGNIDSMRLKSVAQHFIVLQPQFILFTNSNISPLFRNESFPIIIDSYLSACVTIKSIWNFFNTITHSLSFIIFLQRFFFRFERWKSKYLDALKLLLTFFFSVLNHFDSIHKLTRISPRWWKI